MSRSKSITLSPKHGVNPSITHLGNLSSSNKMNKEISLKELNKIAEEVLSKDFYPKKLPNGMWEVAKGIFTNKKGLERFDNVEIDMK